MIDFLQFFTLMKDFTKVDSPGIGWNNYSTKQKNPWVILWLCMEEQHFQFKYPMSNYIVGFNSGWIF